MSTTQINSFFRTTGISAMMIAVVALAFGSKGGGDKKGAASFKSDFTPIRTTNGFTLKTGPVYSGSHILTQEKAGNSISFNTVVTYQKGNTIYILPYKYKVSMSPFNPAKTNLQLFGVKIKMPK